MTRNIYFRLTAVFILALTFACQDEDIVQSNGSTPGAADAFWAQYDFVLGESSYQTRVSYEDIKKSHFDEGDEIGIYVVDDEGNPVTTETNNSNLRYAVREVTNLDNNEQRQVLVPSDPNKTATKNPSYRYVLYYPFDANMTLDRLKNYSHRVATDQSAEGAFEASDLLWCYYTPPADTEAYVVAFDHAMAQIVVRLGGIYAPQGDAVASAVSLLGMRTQATSINLVQPLSDSFTYSTSSTNTGDITAWLFESSSTETGNEDDLQYRACVPAQTLTANTAVVRVQFTETEYRDYTINNDLSLKPGYTYTFILSKDAITEIEIDDDESWVYDVLDPETREPVGLLCREYLHYQPQSIISGDGTIPPDSVTGAIVTADGKQAINSQAWVFYNLQADGKTPELGKGTVLRFIYDVRINNGILQASQAPHYWPLPHTQTGGTHFGIFTAEHGFKWMQSPQPAPNGEYYGISSSEAPKELQDERNLYMHGGTITWDGTNNRIADFTPLAEGAPTNEVAKAYGHIAIDEAGNASVSYAGIIGTGNRDIENNKIGVLSQRYLVDTRLNEDNESETTLYPLVKIGYNQFWISKAFQPTTLTDGTALPCYNKKGDPNGNTIDKRKPADVYFPTENYSENPVYLNRGYIYPFAKNVVTSNGTTTNYDPYNDPNEMAGPQGTEWDGRTSSYRPAPLYNKAAIEDSKFIPSTTESHYEYVMPTVDELQSMMDYFGYTYAAKLCTREISRTIGNNELAYDMYTTLMRGETRTSGGAYPANISGFNLRPTGYYTVQGGMNELSAAGESAALILKSEATANPKSVAYITFQTYDAWSTSSTTDFFEEENTFGNNQDPYSYFFAQVRLFMRFKKPTAENSILSTRSTTVDKERTRNIYVPLVSK